MAGWFQWGASGFAMDNQGAPVHSGTLYLFGNLPGGFAHPMRSVIEYGHYKAKLDSAGRLIYGTASAHAGTGGFTEADKFADWSGGQYACPEQARATLAKLRKP
jgi:hypothetical protein